MKPDGVWTESTRDEKILLLRWSLDDFRLWRPLCFLLIPGIHPTDAGSVICSKHELHHITPPPPPPQWFTITLRKKFKLLQAPTWSRPGTGGGHQISIQGHIKSIFRLVSHAMSVTSAVWQQQSQTVDKPLGIAWFREHFIYRHRWSAGPWSRLLLLRVRSKDQQQQCPPGLAGNADITSDLLSQNLPFNRTLGLLPKGSGSSPPLPPSFLLSRPTGLLASF